MTDHMKNFCPQCDATIEPELRGKDNQSGIYIRCPKCGCKTDGWATELLAWAAWDKLFKDLGY